MHREITAEVESVATDGGQPVISLVGKPGGYPVRLEPTDVYGVIRDALRTGRPVRLTCDTRSREIVDAILA